MFNWFNTETCEKHDWLSYGLMKQCKKCFVVMPVVKKPCPTCEGGGGVYTKWDLVVAILCPIGYWLDPPTPKTCPTCKGMCMVDEEKE